jgi:cysteine desulfurase / selenocysteine lyase
MEEDSGEHRYGWDQRIREIRADFPFFVQNDLEKKPWVYLDNAATTHKPQCVLDAIIEFYTRYNSNIHRGLYELSERATQAFEDARATVAGFLGAAETSEIVFTRGATESLNLLAHCWGRHHLGNGDEILVSSLEHHANIVPWQMVAEHRGATVVPIPMNDLGQLDMDAALQRIASGKVRCLSLVHVSNALGIRVNVEPLIAAARAVGAFTVVDGSQAVAHFPVNVQELGCDAYVFSGHKLFGPTGIGVLWARKSLLESMPPYQGGGDMIRKVSWAGTTFAEPPAKFEAGTPDIAGAIGLGRAIQYVQNLGFEPIQAIDRVLHARAVAVVESVSGLRRLGTGGDSVGVVSFVSDQAHPFRRV